MANTIHKKILIAPNSFKECADSVNVSRMILKAFKSKTDESLIGNADFKLIPVSDGGDGFLEVCRQNRNVDIIEYSISTPYDEVKFDCRVAYSNSEEMIFIETAEVLGLKLIPAEYRNPWKLSSKGMGELLYRIFRDAENGIRAVSKIVIGIGGTGTNDLGVGMMSALGLNLLDEKGNVLDAVPQNFSSASKIELPGKKFDSDIEIIIDVNNPLLGDEGASFVFGPQKGLKPEDAPLMDMHFKSILKLSGVPDQRINTLSGAGGGIAAALQVFFNAKLKYSKDFVKNDLGIDSSKNKFDAVITGEGKVDSQSLLDKGAMVVANEYSAAGIPVYFICGINDSNNQLGENIKIIELQKYFTNAKESIDNFELGLNKACEEIINDLKFDVRH